MKLARGTILPLAVVALVMAAVSATLFYSWRITSRVRVEYPPKPPPPTIKIGVYTDSSCTASVTEIDWGTLMPSDTVQRLVHIRNEGDMPVLLTLSTEAWNPPEAERHMALSWNYTGAKIAVGNGIDVELQLTIFSNCTGITSFSFDIVITAEG